MKCMLARVCQVSSGSLFSAGSGEPVGVFFAPFTVQCVVLLSSLYHCGLVAADTTRQCVSRTGQVHMNMYIVQGGVHWQVVHRWARG
jgi:hypothetical protein